MDALPSLGEALPALRRGLLAPPDLTRLEPGTRAEHPPRILLLYGSLRERSYSRLLVEEADRLLRVLGAETRIFDPRDLPMANSTSPDHPKVQELRALSLWSEGQVWGTALVRRRRVAAGKARHQDAPALAQAAHGPGCRQRPDRRRVAHGQGGR